jgi:hypothetical protein
MLQQREGLMYLLTREEAWKKAADCAAHADVAFDQDTHLLFLRMRDRWLRIANIPEMFELKKASDRRTDDRLGQADSEAA